MPYSESLAARVREALINTQKVEEKKMFRGISFLVNGKMCISVSGEELMCRFDPERQEEIISKAGVRPMIMKGKLLTGYVYVDPNSLKTKRQLEFWIDLCLEFNSKAKASKKKKK